MIKLTPTEIKVLNLIEKGYTNNEIAQTLFVTIYTVKAYVSSILKKFGVKNRTAAIYAAKNSQIKSDN